MPFWHGAFAFECPVLDNQNRSRKALLQSSGDWLIVFYNHETADCYAVFLVKRLFSKHHSAKDAIMGTIARDVLSHFQVFHQYRKIGKNVIVILLFFDNIITWMLLQVASIYHRYCNELYIREWMRPNFPLYKFLPIVQ